LQYRIMSKKTFTWEELRQRNTKQQAYVAIRGKVYDVTKFIDRHPGGRDVLLMAAGRDVTMVFESYHAFSEKAPKVLEKYCVGELVSNKYPTYPETGYDLTFSIFTTISPFFKTVRDRVQKYFKDNNKDPKDPEWMWLRLILFPSLFYMLCYAQLTWLSGSLLWSSGFAIMMGWIGAIIGITHAHDASHFAITHSPWVWKAIGIGTHNFIYGCSYYVWILQHTFGHHPYTNIDGADPDIVTSEKHHDIRRIKDTQTWIQPYVAQHIYAPIIYGLVSILLDPLDLNPALTLKTRLQDCVVVLTGYNSTMPMNSLSMFNSVLFWAGKIAFLIQRFVIPLYFLPLLRVLWINVLLEATASYWLALVFQISHVVSEVEWPQPNEDNRVPRDWAELQVLTTLDYCTDNWFWNTFTGALNHQTTHHLFPGICQNHYPQITPIVRKTCEEFNIKYNYLPTFTQALGAHLGHLKRLGQNSEARIVDARVG
ncbi:hypothetical protein QZH41_014565, partial [Actinostola sp. cb2023]